MLTDAYVASRCLHVAAELGVADHVDDEPVSAAELAARCGAGAGALGRVLRLLGAHGVFERDGDGFRHTPASRLLRSDHPMSMRGFPRMQALPVFNPAYGELEHSIRTGAPAVDKLAPRRPRASPAGHPRRGARRAGHPLLPDVIDTLDVEHERMTPHAGDFFADPLPAADAYVLMEVLHDWPDAECVAILSAVRRAAPAGATVLVVENVLPEERATRAASPSTCSCSPSPGAASGPRASSTSCSPRPESAPGTVHETAGPLRIVEAAAG